MIRQKVSMDDEDIYLRKRYQSDSICDTSILLKNVKSKARLTPGKGKIGVWIMRKNATIYLFNVDQIQNTTTGERVKTVTSVVRIQGSEARNTYEASQAQTSLRGTILIQNRVYKKQQYIYFKENGQGLVYKSNSTARAEDEHLIKINYEDVKEDGLKELIEDAIQEL